MEKGNNVILIGMPGAGKSTAGVVLAKVLGYRFLDSDLLIQETEGRLLREIIAQEGLEGFIAVENRINAGIQANNTVIATGGSVIYGEEAMEHLKSIGTVVYIQLSYEEICHRLGNIKQRGVVLKEDQSLEELYQERCPLYEKYADIIVNAEHTTIESLALTMKDCLQK
ncbi:MAG: shikimate kinase [Lachnospiraceae bacterium]|nr:shikimate kinase [Lachnospiraceae bacterium]